MVNCFFAKFILTKKKPLMGIFQLDVAHNWPNKLPQKSMDEESSSSITHKSPLSFISHKMVLVAFRG
jgi:hypothetical protein